MVAGPLTFRSSAGTLRESAFPLDEAAVFATPPYCCFSGFHGADPPEKADDLSRFAIALANPTLGEGQEVMSDLPFFMCAVEVESRQQGEEQMPLYNVATYASVREEWAIRADSLEQALAARAGAVALVGCVSGECQRVASASAGVRPRPDLRSNLQCSMASFNPFPPEVERSLVRLRGQQIASRTGCTQGIRREPWSNCRSCVRSVRRSRGTGRWCLSAGSQRRGSRHSGFGQNSLLRPHFLQRVGCDPMA